MSTRRHFVQTCAGGLAAAALPGFAQAGFPSKPLALVDPFTAGSNTDYFSRLLADRLGPLLGGQVVVENKAGAGGIVGADYVAKAKPDGYTLGMASVSTLCAGPAVHSGVRYDPVKDFTYITKLVTLPSVLVVNNKFPARDFRELLAQGKAQPGRISFGMPGVGSAGHVLLEYLMHLAGVKFLPVPYKGSGPMLTDLIAGQLDAMSDNIPSVLPHIRSGAVRALAVRDVKRLSVLPDVPTYAELGLREVSQPLWFGLVGPAKMPAAIVDSIRAAAHKSIAEPGFVEKTQALSATVSPSSSKEFAADAAALLDKLRQVVKVAGIKPE
jgi:tripartite-type tricarboxylate transporter receptor subunit TctC